MHSMTDHSVGSGRVRRSAPDSATSSRRRATVAAWTLAGSSVAEVAEQHAVDSHRADWIGIGRGVCHGRDDAGWSRPRQVQWHGSAAPAIGAAC